MAINTQSELVSHLRFLAGESSNSLTTEEAVRLLNFGLDRYSYIALTSDGRWQFDDTENTDVPRASATLSSGEISMPLNSTHLGIRFIEVTDSDGNKYRLSPFDRTLEDGPTPKTTDTGQPSKYDYEAGVLYFDRYSDASYTVTIHFNRSASHLTTANTTQVVGIPTIHTEYIVLFALHRLGFRTGNENRTQLRQELVELERSIQDDLSNRNEDTAERLSVVNYMKK